jgi:thiamine-phosphate pyrophosphorylase
LSLQFHLPKIYPITDPYISGISHLEQVTRLIRGGARLIQLRDKHAAPADFFTAALDCVTLARSHGVQIIVNDRVDIAKAAGADGVHLGQDDMPAREARKILGETAIIGVSTHSDDQARESRRLPINYIAIGPVFTTGSKGDPDPVVGVDGIRSVRAVVGDISLVAIGGINEQSLSTVLTAGADSAAIISELVRHPDTVAEKMRTMTSIADLSV